jgi:hypothetical protein
MIITGNAFFFFLSSCCCSNRARWLRVLLLSSTSFHSSGLVFLFYTATALTWISFFKKPGGDGNGFHICQTDPQPLFH